jgi:outer membrane biosynthesis protein TonB
LSDEQEARYKVTFLGPVRNDLTTVNKLAEGLKERFKLSDEAVTRMMKMAPVAIKSGATLSEAHRYKEVLETLGGKVQVEPIEELEEEPQQTEESTPSSDQEPQAAPDKEKTPPPSPEAAAPQKEKPQAPETEEEISSPLDREPQVIPVKAKTAPPPPPPAESTASSGTKTKTEPQMVKCPQCGYVQEQTDECIRCGIIISKFLKYQEEVKPPEVEAAAPDASGGPAAGLQPREITSAQMEGEGSYTPWEDMANLGFLTAFFRTLTAVLFSPSRFFREMSVDKNIHYSLIYGIIMGFFVALSALLWQFAFSGLMGETEGMQGMEALFAPFFFIIYALVLPLLIAYGLFVISGILHTALMIVGGNRKGLDCTFRVVAYTQSTQVFYLIPVLGAFIYLIYTPILLAIGFKESHQISTGKAVFAVILPILIAVILTIIVVVMFVPLVLSLIPQMMMQQQPPPGF